MQTGLAAGIFIIIALVVMSLFCIVTKYYHHKLKKALENTGEVYSMIDQITHSYDDIEGQYDEYVKKREQEGVNSGLNSKTNQDDKQFLIEMTSVRQPLKNQENNIYATSTLKKRLEGQTIPLKTQTHRSINSLKSFRPEKIDSVRSKHSEENLQDNLNEPKKSFRKKNQNKVITHKSISKLIAYNQNGITMIDNDIQSMRRIGGIISQKKMIKNSQIKPTNTLFEDQLEANGFIQGEYKAYKVISTFEIPHMKDNQQYPVRSLKVVQQKEPIQFVEYYILKDQLENSI